MNKIYLAGFDVFRQDAVEHGNSLKQLCEAYGFEGLFPLDNAAPPELSGNALAQWIYESNIGLIGQADLVIANVNNFRGAEPDSGTCFEIGFAIASQKPVWVYLEDSRPLIEQIPHSHAGNGVFLDSDGYVIENFCFPRNLMIACSSRLVVGGAEECLRQLKLHMAR